jgi:hypothetical protein
VSNCYIHDNGHLDFGALGISSTYSQDTTIANNLVERQPYTGIGGSLTCLTFPSHRDYKVTIQRNIVRDVMQQLDDGGGIYTKDGMAKTSEISGNLVENYGGRGFGIYLDDRSYGPHLADNMISAKEAFHLNTTTHEQFTWGKNYTNGNFPDSLKEQAGPQGPYRRFFQSRS